MSKTLPTLHSLYVLYHTVIAGDADPGKRFVQPEPERFAADPAGVSHGPAVPGAGSCAHPPQGLHLRPSQAVSLYSKCTYISHKTLLQNIKQEQPN